MENIYEVTYVCEVCKKRLTEEEVEIVDGTCVNHPPTKVSGLAKK